MATTFKLFLPGGDCRRVTFDSVPELAAINELVDGMVEVTSERRQLTYVDSEGDRVVIKTSRDVTEAVHDAREAGAKTIKVYIRPRGRCGANRNGDSSTHPEHGGSRRRAGPWGGRCGRGLFVHPAEVSGEWKEIADVFGAIFPGLFVSPDTTTTSTTTKDVDTEEAARGHNNNDADEAAPTKSTETTPDTTSTTKDVETEEAARGHNNNDADEEQAAPTKSTETSRRSKDDGESMSNPQDPTEPVPVPPPTVNEQVTSQVSPDQADDLEAKATLLRDMGFEIPLDVARNMISEMGGRMDLIVRALVANQK